MAMNRFLHEPLVHFILLGALIFAASAWLGGERQSQGTIQISSGEQEHMINMFTRAWQRPPSPQELQAMLQDRIREEIAYREGITMGIDQGDTIIRRRMRQKFELLNDEFASFTAPTEAELEQFLEENEEDFRFPLRFDLRQVFISAERRGTGARAHAAGLLEQLRSGPDADWSSLGDSLPLPSALSSQSLVELERHFGSQFAGSLAGLDAGEWGGPVESAYGLHLVIIDRRMPAREPRLDEIRDRVKAEWLEQRRLAAMDSLYERLSEKYSIEIEPLAEGGEK